MLTHLYLLLLIMVIVRRSRQDHHRPEVGVWPVPDTGLAAPDAVHAIACIAMAFMGNALPLLQVGHHSCNEPPARGACC